jgi:ADP-ribosyl-[dinitrogen reductase] hydrolase
MLLEIAVADSYGCCFEWTDSWIIKNKNKLKYITLEENPSLIKPGNYTDDTQMTLAMAEFMLSGEKWDHYNLAQKFVECFHRDPRRGYAPGFYLFLLNHKNGVDFVHDIRPNSNRSGAAMRAAPVGLIENLYELKRVSDIQAALTHNTAEGRDSALCAALMVHYFKYDLGSKAELVDWLDQFVKIDFSILDKHKDHIPVEGWPCTLAALKSILDSDSFSEVLINGVNFAGDTDTICAIAAGPASFCKEIKQDLPQELVDGLENGEYGRDYIIELDKRLLGA